MKLIHNLQPQEHTKVGCDVNSYLHFLDIKISEADHNCKLNIFRYNTCTRIETQYYNDKTNISAKQDQTKETTRLS